MDIREEFEEWYWGRYGEAFECTREEAFEIDESGIHEIEHARFSFDSWIASRLSVVVELPLVSLIDTRAEHYLKRGDVISNIQAAGIRTK